MENKREPLKNVHSLEECSESDVNEMYVKFEREQSHAQPDSMNISGNIVKSKIHKCDICSKSFELSAHLKTHKRSHTGEHPYSCQKCAKQFTTQLSLSRHLKIHTAEKNFQCDDCEKSFKSKFLLKSHMRSHTGEHSYSCHICGKTCATSSNLKDHMKTHKDYMKTQSGEKEFMCDQCDYATFHQLDLKRHILTHTGERNFQCGDCGKAFARASTLTRHMRVHTGERPFKCDKCSETFRFKNTLVAHKGKHRGVADFLCDMCTKTFFDPFSLKQHKKCHNPAYKRRKQSRLQTEKKFDCKTCGKAFRNNNLLHTHMRTHTGEKPYVCNECGKAFNKSCNLKVHTLIHSGETPFKCTECHKGFRELFPLKKHALKIHGMEYKHPTLPQSEKQSPKPPVPPLLLSTNQFPDHFAFAPHLQEKQFLESHIPHSPPSLDIQFPKPPLPPPSSEKQFPKPSIQTLPPPEDQFLEPLDFFQHLAEDELKVFSNLEDKSVPPCPTSTIPCAKESFFSEVDVKFVNNENIKIEPSEINGDTFGCENIEVKPPKEADDTDCIKMEMECQEFGNNKYIKVKSEESDENMKVELMGFENDAVKIGSHVSYEKMESTINSIFNEEKNNGGDKIIENQIDDVSKTDVKISSETKYYICEYKCSKCKYKCSSESDMKKHLIVHTNERPFLCDLCPKTYKDQTTLRKHRTYSHPASGDEVKYYPCDECEYKSNIKQNTKTHMKNSHNNNERLQCEYCPNSYKNRYSLCIHVGSAHDTGASTITCEDCGKPCQTRIHLLGHKRVCAKAAKLVCDECGKSCASSFAMRNHKMQHSGNKPFECDQCSSKFTRRCDFKKHVRNTHKVVPEEEKNVNGKIIELNMHKCNFCFKSFGSSAYLKTHVRSHTGEFPYSCHKCVKQFTTKISLERHLMIHTGEKNFQCEDCGKSFRLKGLLKSHRRSHTGERSHSVKIHTCHICGKTCATTSYLKDHMKTHKDYMKTQSGEKEFTCDQCDYATFRRSNLKAHLLTHTGEKNFHCGDCGKAFARASTLSDHMRGHTGERPYKCDKCSETFARAFTLKVHRKVHTVEKPYKCEDEKGSLDSDGLAIL